eukprot:scaffold577397_cov149-Attheya_sp.AAC.1
MPLSWAPTHSIDGSTGRTETHASSLVMEPAPWSSLINNITKNSITNGLPGILGYATHSNGKGYNDLKCAYEDTEQLVDAKYA